MRNNELLFRFCIGTVLIITVGFQGLLSFLFFVIMGFCLTIYFYQIGKKKILFNLIIYCLLYVVSLIAIPKGFHVC